MQIKCAKIENFDSVMAFYYNLTDSMQGAQFHPGWEKDIYPTRQFIKDSILQNQLFVALLNDEIIGAMVLNQTCVDGYENVHWHITAHQNEVIVIHALGVSQGYQGQGIAKKMLNDTIESCKKSGLKAIRLDVLAQNLPAQKLYPAAGFTHVDTMQLFYEDTGLTDFLLYELAL